MFLAMALSMSPLAIVWTGDHWSSGLDLCRGRPAFKTACDHCCLALLFVPEKVVEVKILVYEICQHLSRSNYLRGKTIVSENQSNPGLQVSMHMIKCSPDFELETWCLLHFVYTKTRFNSF